MNANGGHIRPRIIIHGGAGAINHTNLPPERWREYEQSLLTIMRSAQALLLKDASATALDVATYAVSLLEDNPLFNCGRGAVFTRAGTVELESSVMVSNPDPSSGGYSKRGVGCMVLKRTKNPIKLAREFLIRGNEDLVHGSGGQSHSQLSGEEMERLAEDWGLQTVDPSYFWTKKRWEEHRRGLKTHMTSTQAEPGEVACTADYDWCADEPSWDGQEYLPQGTVGAVVLDRFGTLCVATSTGGLTNKLPGRIGDTPTLGAGFWAEEWTVTPQTLQHPATSLVDMFSRGDMLNMVSNCLGLSSFVARLQKDSDNPVRRAVAMSGTGNGDSFLRINAVRTAAAMCRFSTPHLKLQTAVSRVVGPHGELQRSAGDRWGKTGEGEGGIIGIELIGDVSKIVFDFCCGGMFRAWIDDEGHERCMVFHSAYNRRSNTS